MLTTLNILIFMQQVFLQCCKRKNLPSEIQEQIDSLCSKVTKRIAKIEM